MAKDNLVRQPGTIVTDQLHGLTGYLGMEVWDPKHEAFDPWRTPETKHKLSHIRFDIFAFGIGQEMKLCYQAKLETKEWTFGTAFHYGRTHKQLSAFLNCKYSSCNSLLDLPEDAVAQYESFLASRGVSRARSYTAPLNNLLQFVTDLHKFQRSKDEISLADQDIPQSKLSELTAGLAGYWCQGEWNIYDRLFDKWRTGDVKGAGIVRFAALPDGIKQELQFLYKTQLQSGEFTLQRVAFFASTHIQLARFLRLRYPGCRSLIQLPLETAGKEYWDFLTNAGLRCSNSYTPLLNIARLFFLDFYSDEFLEIDWKPTFHVNADQFHTIEASLSGHWGEDVWDTNNPVFNPWHENSWTRRSISLNHFGGLPIGFKEEMKFYYKSHLENLTLKLRTVFHYGASMRKMGAFLRRRYPMIQSFAQLPDGFLSEYEEYLRQRDCVPHRYFTTPINQAHLFFLDYYDTRDEFDKDVWDTKKIVGAKHASHRVESTSINFTQIPMPFRPVLKKYAKVMLVNLSVSQVGREVLILRRFINFLQGKHPEWPDLTDLSRQDMEDYFVWLRNFSNGKVERHYIQQLIYLRKFLEYIQNAAYPEAPSRLISGLMFSEDIPYRNVATEENIKYIPEEVLFQMEEHLMDLDRPHYIPVIILLRATGWRVSDILNLRYNKCLENKADGWYICGDITKTKVLNHRVPITEEIASVVRLAIEQVKENSTPENNPERFLFVNYRGKRMGIPYMPAKISGSLNRLAIEKQIKDSNGAVFHFRNHAFRHTKAVELINNGMSLVLVQKWLAHESPNMTQIYAKLLDSTMRKSWEEVARNGVFRLKESGYFGEVEADTPQSEDTLEWEYVRSNLDAVRMPLGYCMKPIKLECKHQISPCLTCHNLCTTPSFLPQFQEEKNEVLNMIERGKQLGRNVWVEKNEALLERYESVVRVLEEGQIHHPAGKKGRETSEREQAKTESQH